jgi:ABC-type sugar transport system ATPase subunit
VAPTELEEAVMTLVEQAPEAVREDLASGRQVIYTLHVLDDVAEDLDQVTVMVDGVSYGTVTLTNMGQDLIVPLVAGAAANVTVLAEFDGGGGVTFGAYSSLGETRSRVMMVGESDIWTVIAP